MRRDAFGGFLGVLLCTPKRCQIQQSVDDLEMIKVIAFFNEGNDL